MLRLTPAGQAAHAAAGSAFLPVLDRVVTSLGREEPQVRKALAVLRQSIDRAGTEAG